MSPFVLDASVALSWFIDRPVPALSARIQQTLLRGERAIVPSLWHLEMANGLVGAERRGFLSNRDVDACLVAINHLLISAIESDNEVIPVDYAARAAQTHQLTSYDAVYLELARRRGIALATLDTKLRSAAARAGIPVL